MAVRLPNSTAPKSSGSLPKKSASSLKIQTGAVVSEGQRIGIYGSGGIGKTELAANLIKVGVRPLFVDLDKGTFGLNVARVSCAEDGEALSFESIRSLLQSDDWLNDYDAVVIDTFTALEEVIARHVLDNVPCDNKGKKASSLEDFSFGKGLIHVFEHALLILQDLDQLARKGKHIVLICHQVAERVPSADSEDYLEYQPRLQSPNKTAKTRERVFEWCNHFFRLDHDRAVFDGKAANGDARSIFCSRTTTAWAKHRTLSNGQQIPERLDYEKGSFEIWSIIFEGTAK